MIIKLRAWDEISQSMVYPDFPQNPRGLRSSDILQRWSSKCIMQYIGKEDERGKGMYHFDIVENESGRRALVVYFVGPSYCGWDLTGLNSKGYINKESWWEGYTIIGDKFRNPELMEE